MSNVKVNGNTYASISSVRLPLADGSGYATFTEGAMVDNTVNLLISQCDRGDMTFEDVTDAYISAFGYNSGGTISFPNAAVVRGLCNKGNYDNMLFPKATKIDQCVSGIASTFNGSTISGTLDLSALTSNAINNQIFYGTTIGTLLLGAYAPRDGIMGKATITNLWWNNTAITAGDFATALDEVTAVTNLYLPDAVYDDFKALMDDGTITGVTNLYKISEWSGE